MSKICAALSLTTLIAAAGCRHDTAGAKSMTAVRVHAVERSTARSGVRYSATINPASRVELAFKVGGYVHRMAKVRGIDGKQRIVQEGDLVNLRQELAAVRAADYDHKLAEAKAGLAEAKAAREKAQIDFDRATKLSSLQSLPKAEMDAARVNLDAVTARAEGARVRVAEGQTSVEDTRLRSPMSGVIVKRYIELGTLVAPGSVAFSLADTSTVKAVFGVPDTELEVLRLGAPQTLTTEALHGREIEGRITRIAPVADAKSHVFEVEVSVPNDDDTLKPGMIASLNLNQSTTTPSLTVLPLNAVVRSPGHASRFAVFIVDQKVNPPVARLREVELGEFLGNQIPIRAGLADGDRVVVQGASLISDGEAVQVIP